MSERIDAHQHFWSLAEPFNYAWLDAPALAPIRRDRMPADLEPLLRQADIQRCVTVQTQHDERENAWALGLADQHAFIAGVVGWVDLTSPHCEARLLHWRQYPEFVGVRHVTQDEPDDEFIVRPEVMAGLRVLEKHGVPFDLLFHVRHLRHAATLARALPNLPLVLDHLAKPRIAVKSLDDWRPHLRAAAAFPNVFCKLSGLATEANWRAWSPADLNPYVEEALAAFGPSRCMFGSDWPVCELAGDHARIHGTLAELTAALSESEQREIFGGVAQRFYKLPTAH